MKNIFKGLIILLLTLQLSSVFAWGTIGHRVVAEIAEHHLTRKAKKNIKKIIGNQKLAYWSNWGDFIKSDPHEEFKKMGNSHFINTNPHLPWADFQVAMENSSEENLYKTILRLENSFSDKNLTLDKKKQNLYMLIHLIGDAHQPMHVSRAEDQGGNKIEVTWFGKKSNIHRVWDSDLIDNEKYSYTEYAGVLDILNKSEITQLQTGNLANWLFESNQLSDKIYADVEHNANLSYNYIYDNIYTVENCMLKGGLRLAKVLNDIFG
ncbi:S1/P1 nuclease [Sphingobacterium sp. SRCM116780]|uniref:S1/P1 nuclease n=1 Tax=Sphingobacterium sp. SRCM116780 TaxID=2907623 RepID=UPI001F2D6E80|nr:S1/P1 nuclease [Sphingobacterium sp. SRCM116780]UIR57153.1 S1/P1 nuclease [Sphingobacterium sp. SRCM116780]